MLNELYNQWWYLTLKSKKKSKCKRVLTSHFWGTVNAAVTSCTLMTGDWSKGRLYSSSLKEKIEYKKNRGWNINEQVLVQKVCMTPC